MENEGDKMRRRAMAWWRWAGILAWGQEVLFRQWRLAGRQARGAGETRQDKDRDGQNRQKGQGRRRGGGGRQAGVAEEDRKELGVEERRRAWDRRREGEGVGGGGGRGRILSHSSSMSLSLSPLSSPLLPVLTSLSSLSISPLPACLTVVLSSPLCSFLPISALHSVCTSHSFNMFAHYVLPCSFACMTANLCMSIVNIASYYLCVVHLLYVTLPAY